jgi:hypothetical protein
MFDRLGEVAAVLAAALKQPGLSDGQRADVLAQLKQIKRAQRDVVRFMRRQRNGLRRQVRTLRLQVACVRRPRPRQYRPRRQRVSRGPCKARAPDDPDPEPERVAAAPLGVTA